MENDNSYLSIVENKTDDEIVEMIENPEKVNNALLYEAAVRMALKRELITEFQADNLLDGNMNVLQYNPDYLGENYVRKDEPKTDITKFFEKSGIKRGLYITGCGVLLLIFSYFRSTFSWWRNSCYPYVWFMFGGIVLVFGLIVLLVEGIKKIRKKSN